MKNRKPILFNTEMVLAILEGRKTQTRRIVKDEHLRGAIVNGDIYSQIKNKCPYGKVGDVLWARETHLWVSRDHAHDLLEGNKDGSQLVYKTSFHDDWIKYAKEKYGYKWKPSIHMPFEACRLFLEITNIRVERLHEISEDDAKNEGIEEFTKDGVGFKYGLDGWHWSSPTGKPFMCYNRKIAFGELWQSVYGAESWDTNPWVWVIEFKQITKEEALS